MREQGQDDGRWCVHQFPRLPLNVIHWKTSCFSSLRPVDAHRPAGPFSACVIAPMAHQRRQFKSTACVSLWKFCDFQLCQASLNLSARSLQVEVAQVSFACRPPGLQRPTGGLANSSSSRISQSKIWLSSSRRPKMMGASLMWRRCGRNHWMKQHSGPPWMIVTRRQGPGALSRQCLVASSHQGDGMLCGQSDLQQCITLGCCKTWHCTCMHGASTRLAAGLQTHRRWFSEARSQLSLLGSNCLR